MTTKHTPGPWIFDPNEPEPAIRTAATHEEVVPRADWLTTPDAYLIAAAPDLKHACLAALGFLAGASILTKEQLQETLVEALKKAGVNS